MQQVYLQSNNQYIIDIKQKATELSDAILNICGNRVKFIGTIGTTSITQDFVQGHSDLDLVVIINKIDYEILNKIFDLSRPYTCSGQLLLDIRIYDVAENDIIDKVGALDTLNPWIIDRFNDGTFNVLYKDPEFNLCNSTDKRRGILLSMFFFINKLRRYMYSKSYFLRGEEKNPTNSELKKTTIGAAFCIAKFYLADQGIMAATYDEIISSMNKFAPGPILITLRKLKSVNGPIDQTTVMETYAFCEKLYHETISKQV